MKKLTWMAVLLSALVLGCKQGLRHDSSYTTQLSFGPGEETKIEEAFLSLTDSTEVLLKAGTYNFETLSIAQVKHISIRGEGSGKTILDFKNQKQGGEGIRVTDVRNLKISGMLIQNSKGDLLKINKGNDIEIMDLHAVWNTPDSSNGGYGIYPVLCNNVLIENCYAQGASDAGIYVGQSNGIIVRNSKASQNVAGCEIENSTDAEVYGNEFYNNTAGFLVFDLPDLSQRGGRVKAYNNKIYGNNFRNFAKSGSFGTSWGVGNAAPGSGVIILATSDVQIYDNEIVDNNTSAIMIASGFSVDEKAAEKINEKYFPIPKKIKVYGNTIRMGSSFPEPARVHHIGQLVIATESQLNKVEPNRAYKRIPAILYDGVTSNVLNQGIAPNPDEICIKQPGENMFVRADFGNLSTPAAWKPSSDSKPFACE